MESLPATKALSHFNLLPDNTILQYRHLFPSQRCAANLSSALRVDAVLYIYNLFNEGKTYVFKFDSKNCIQYKTTAMTVVFLPESMHQESRLNIHGTV